MDRDYKTGKSDSVGVFSGIEVEHTPAFGKQTLFLARNDLYYDQIEKLAENVKAEAIYFGANRSFMYNHATQINQMIRLLRKGYYVTIDYPHAIHEEVKARFESIWTHEKFIPFCSVIFPTCWPTFLYICTKMSRLYFRTSPSMDIVKRI